MAGERTEKATPKKREDERKKGNIFQSRDITIALSLLIMFVSLRLMGGYLYNFLQQIMVRFMSGFNNIPEIRFDSMTQLSVYVLSRVLILVLPLLLISALSSFILTGLQTRFNLSKENIAFKFSRLNPLNGLKKTFSVKALFQLIKSLAVIAVIGYVIYVNIKDFSYTLGKFYIMPPAQSVSYIASQVFSIFIKVSGVILAIGAVDYFVQWWQYEKSLRMSKEEIKEEFKQTEGDPIIKSAIRSRQRRLVRMRMMQRVPKADVVIVNPEHYAVALRYDEKENRSPVVIAKGRDYVALKIKEIAAQHNIRIEENPPLARALFKAVEIDEEIPAEFYQAVAEILSYVYSIRRKQAN